MPILNISTAEIRDGKAFQHYVEKAAVLLEAQGVGIICRGRHVRTMRGADAGPHIVAVFRFSSMEAVRRFYEAPAYQPLIALRDAACDMTIRLYEEP